MQHNFSFSEINITFWQEGGFIYLFISGGVGETQASGGTCGVGIEIKIQVNSIAFKCGQGTGENGGTGWVSRVMALASVS